ncbi:sensor histidine kinase [Acinetobacter guillouiae]|uniref:sensor histidine kinase n=1 Tax=Acinetobacter TaxID=469 RepID=UPI003AF66086
MNKSLALELLSSSSSHDRFKAAHALINLVDNQDLRTIQVAKHNETDTYVLSRLEALILKISEDNDPENPDPIYSDTDISNEKLFAHAKAQAIEWVSGLLLHEIGSKLGLVSLSASKDIESYNESRTKYHIQNLQAIFDAIEQLRKATNPSKHDQFDLSELIEEIISFESSNFLSEFSKVGPRPFIINSSRHLIRLALCNGIRNAIEATKSIEGLNQRDMPPIVVAWGETDSEYWISVLDEGIGLSASSINIFEIGKSTKSGHIGFGLSIARQALDTLGGNVTIESQLERGVKYEIRWSKVL